ncbi:MAG: transcription antitermination factor NusB [Amphritea sp.]
MSDTPAPKKQKKPSLTSMRRSARSFALQALYQWQISGNSITDIELQFRMNNDMSGTDLPLFSELLHGVPAKASELDAAYEPFLDRALSDLDPVELAILRIGSFELNYRIVVPYKVVINESVELAKIFGATDSHRYINGILDKLAARVRMSEINAKRK